MIGSMPYMNLRTYPKKAFEQRNNKTQLKINPGLVLIGPGPESHIKVMRIKEMKTN